MDRILIVTWLVFLACVALARADDRNATASRALVAQGAQVPY